MNTARLHQRFLLCSGANTDTRKIKQGSMYFALKGENFDGNLFAADALAAGARYVVVDDKLVAESSEQYILVKNVLESLQKLALFHRNYLGIPILAITGSNGKTTTKELINAVLSRKFKTIATHGNLNNHIGVPLTLLSMDQQTEFGIVEMGANHPLEIAFLCTIANPDYGYITNFGKAHLEGFGSLEGVVKAKTELYHYLQEETKLIFLNLDDEVQQKHRNYKHTFAFGENPESEVQVKYLDGEKYAGVHYNQTDFISKLTGNYNGRNMAAALCIGLYFKVPFDEIEKAIAAYSPDNNRSEMIEAGSNTIILDAYNANPTSMQAALQNFTSLKTDKQKIAILGDMFELGSSAPVEHQTIITDAENGNLTEIYLLGDNFNLTETSSSFTFKFKSMEALKNHLEETNFNNCYFLIKGSRGMALERVLENIPAEKSSKK
ncbi:UDP-N-acetylmuramoyl-tripeptide--D-alanyl-D-alanine ligase [Christiangramia marina]|uniref:UDP-N-acetylmuramoyl-tripeptide--D-alanyl-D- alanine ligase n=1 Tax=Christiangramia marina TaxID=409436 RepID=UPI003AA8AFA9